MAAGIVVVGASWGGIDALRVLLGGLPEAFALPVAIVHHLGGHSGELRAVLQRYTRLPVEDPDDKAPIVPGRVFIAPGGYHLLVEGDHFALSTEAPVQHARPSIDVLFESAADSYAARVVGVVLTGASRDGAQGAAAIKRRGGVVLVQDPAEAVSPILPRAAIAATAVDRVLALADIAPALVRLGQRPAR